MEALARAALVAAMLAASGLVASCGQKGPLYLPDDGPENGGERTRAVWTAAGSR